MNPRIEQEEDLHIIKDFILLPILLDMLVRDMEELKLYEDKIVYSHVILYLQQVEGLIHAELQAIKARMRKQDIQILTANRNAQGIQVEYKVRGYIHRFSMLRSLIKAELMTMLTGLRGRTP
ncbi:hypothetical protein [Paenibacillus filicis]